MTAESEQPRPLWAPWRIEYVGKPKANDCIFCAKAHNTAADVENLVLARGEHAFVLLNAYPYNCGHLMVAPYAHVADLADLAREQRQEIIELLVQAERVLRRAMQPSGFNLGFNIGADAGAGIADHLHGHVVPRWPGDTNFMPVLNNTRVVSQALVDTAALLRQAWQAELGVSS